MTTRLSSFRRLLGIFALALAAACQKSPVNPSPQPPPTTALSVTCPPNLTVQVDATPAPISYATPIASGGTAPLTTTCTIPSGTTLPAGSSDVICTTIDALQRSAQCTFNITVTVNRRLRGTTFLAFGDSITAGEIAQPLPTVHDVDPARAYPTVLERLLKEHYSGQTADIVVTNRGESGAWATKDEDRFVETLTEVRPNAVLLLEGINDIHSNVPSASIAQSLRANIYRACNAYGVDVVFISTLLPELEPWYDPDEVLDVNDEIRSVAGRDCSVLVDAYEIFEPQKDLLIGQGGLHPTDKGYEVLAQAFFEAIQREMEETVPPPAEPGAPASILRSPLRRR